MSDQTQPDLAAPRNSSFLQRRSCCIAAASIILLLAFIAGRKALVFMEKGLNDGPFYSLEFKGANPTSPPDEKVSIGSKTLEVYNSVTSSPLLLLRDAENRIITRQILDVKTNPDYSHCELTSITVLSTTRGLLRDRIEIVGRWSFGHEWGVVFLWKSGWVHRFYLSW